MLLNLAQLYLFLDAGDMNDITSANEKKAGDNPPIAGVKSFMIVYIIVG